MVGRVRVSVVALVSVLCGCSNLGGGSGAASCADSFKYDDAVEAVAWRCVGAGGGTITIPATHRTELVIPAGALSKSTRIVVRRRKRATPNRHLLVLEPAGLKFSKPAVLRMTHEPTAPGEHPILSVFQSSAGSKERRAGSEVINWERPRVTAYDAITRTWDVELDHFSFVVAMFRVQDLAYLVLDLPGWSLRPADVLVTLTTMEGDEGPSWAPGHVGMVREVQADGINGGSAQIVESTSFPKSSSTSSGVRYLLYPNFKSVDGGHLYLGARRARGAALSSKERLAAIKYARQQFVNKAGYSSVGFGAVGNFSCVGIVEESLDAAGRGMFGNWNEFFGGTPYEVYQDTAPISEIQVVAGRPTRIPVYIVSAGTRTSGPGKTDGLHLITRYTKLPATITVTGLPSGATFAKAAGGGYELKWTPAKTDMSKSFPLEFGFSETLRDVEGGRRVTLSQKLTLQVLGHLKTFTVVPGKSLSENGYTYNFYPKLLPSAKIISAELVDVATGLAPPAQPFVDHEFTILHQGRQLDAQGKPTEKYGISFRVRNTKKTVIQAPAQQWQWRLNFDTPDWRGDLNSPPP